MARNVSASRLRPDRKAKGECCASGICYGRRQLIRTVLAGRALVVVRMPSAVGADENPAGTLYKAPQRLPRIPAAAWPLSAGETERSEEHTSELQSLMRISYAVFCLKKKKHKKETYQL